MKSAINTFVLSMKSSGLWAKMPFIYPMVSDGILQTRGFQHKFNLKDPRDLDAAFRISFGGTQSHDAFGATTSIPSGNFFNPFLLGYSIDNFHLSFYTSDSVLTPNAGGVYSIGNANGSLKTMYLMVNRTTLPCASNIGSDSNVSVYNPGVAITGMVTGVRSSTSSNKVFLNGVLKTNVTTTITDIVPDNSNFRFFQNSPTRCQYASGGVALTDAEVLTHYNIVKALQTALGR